MACFHPLKGYRSSEVNPETGKRGITFNPTKRYVEGSSLLLPCGQCVGCRADRALQWSMRFGHEAKLYESNLFLSLTYDNQHVPQDYSVKLDHYQKFMKRLRKRFGRKRFGGCGEYGDYNLRPHYHLGVFDLDLADKRQVAMRGNYPVFTSETLRELWPFGSHEIGRFTHEAGGYIARYIFKKMTGEKADEHYRRVSPIDGQVYQVAPEFFTMSRRPGIGQGWLEQFAGDAFPSDFVIVDGRKVRPATFYLSKQDEALQERIKRARKARAVKPEQKANSTPERLAVREQVQLERMKRLKRQL